MQSGTGQEFKDAGGRSVDPDPSRLDPRRTRVDDFGEDIAHAARLTERALTRIGPA
jgi:hypothetical protein